jgi:hypothetical protein
VLNREVVAQTTAILCDVLAQRAGVRLVDDGLGFNLSENKLIITVEAAYCDHFGTEFN